MSEKLFILGLDGATFDIISPMMAEGLLPSFLRLVNEGASGQLQSTLPPQSSVAWPVMLTGTGPGKTAIFAFWQYESGSWERPLVHSGLLRAPTLFDYLADAGRNGISFNVPVSFPARENPSTTVCGLLTPSLEAGMTKPQSLLVELIARGITPPLEMDLLAMVGANPDTALIERLFRNLDIRERISGYLMDSREWDCFLSVFTISDRIQHFFWDAYDPNHPGHTSEKKARFGDVIRQCYIRLDTLLGRLMDRLDGVPLIVLSDHGFGPKLKNFFINRWLVQEGYLHLKPGFRRVRIRGFRRPRFVPRAPHEIIDWKKSVAYANWVGSQEGIYINLKGRELQGNVEDGEEYDSLISRIKKDLSEVRDPDTGERIVESVYHREEIYKGPYTHLAPDIVMTLKNHSYMPAPGLFEKKLFRSTADSEFAGTQEGETGQHRENGIVLVHGKGIAKGKKLHGAKLEDILPLAMYLMDLPIPLGLDGVIPENAFDKDFLIRQKPRFAEICKTGTKVSGKEHGFYDRQENLVKDRLRGLGYIE